MTLPVLPDDEPALLRGRWLHPDGRGPRGDGLHAEGRKGRGPGQSVGRTDRQMDRQSLLSLGRHEALTNRSQSPKGRCIGDVRVKGLPQKQKQLGKLGLLACANKREREGESKFRQI